MSRCVTELVYRTEQLFGRNEEITNTCQFQIMQRSNLPLLLSTACQPLPPKPYPEP